MVCLSRPYLFKFFEGCPRQILLGPFTAQKMKFSIKDFFSECDQIRSFLRIRSNFLKKSLMKNFYAVILEYMDWFTVRYVQSHIQNYIRHLDGAFCVTKWDGWQGCEYPFDALLQLVVRLLLTLLYLVASLIFLYVMLCMIWYLLYNLKNVKNTHGGVLLLVINTLPWVFFTLFKLYKWYGIGRSVSYFDKLQQTSCSIHTLKPQNMFNNWMKFRPKAFCRPGLRWRVKKRICCLNLFHGMFHLPSGLSESHFILKEF